MAPHMNISNHSQKLSPPINLCSNHKNKSTISTDKTVCSSTTTTSATACGDSVLTTRTPSPSDGDIITPSHVQVIMDGLGNKKIPPLSSSSPSSSPRNSYITYADDTNGCSIMNDDTDHTIDSTAAAAAPQSREEADRDEDDEEDIMIPRGLPPSRLQLEVQPNVTSKRTNRNSLTQSLPPNANTHFNNGGSGGEGGGIELKKKWIPKGRKKGGQSRSSSLFSSFSKKKNTTSFANHSSHPTQLSHLLEEDDNVIYDDNEPIRRNSLHDTHFTDTIQQDGYKSAAEVARMLRGESNHSIASSNDGGGPTSRSGTPLSAGEGSSHQQHQRNSSILSAYSAHSMNELDNTDFNSVDSKTMLENLGSRPSQHELANIAAVRAKEYIEECLSADVSVLDRKKWEDIPQFTKMDLVVGTHLGKGSFSDVFEVFATVVENEAPTIQSLGSDRADLDKLLVAKFGEDMSDKSGDSNKEEGNNSDGDDLDKEIDAMFGNQQQDGGDEDLDNKIDAMFDNPLKETTLTSVISGSELEVDIQSSGALSAKKSPSGFNGRGRKSFESLRSSFTSSFSTTGSIQEGQDEDGADDLDKEIDALFGNPKKQGPPRRPSLRSSASSSFSKKSGVSSPILENDEEQPKEFQPQQIQPLASSMRRRPRRRATDAGASICMGTQARIISKKRERKVVLAMKCLRPQIRSDADQFIVGVEDLVHETAMLACLNHPHIVKLHGRAGGSIYNSFRLSDGFFILIDRLKDTLDDRINRWRKTNDKKAPPSMSQLKVAISIADAMSYLHSKKIIFRDLKPANVGFDPTGVLKLFDFGFAIGVDEPPKSSSISSGETSDRKPGLLYDKCGTPRYMAPEVGLVLGYNLPADVYSFGILLWEIFALKKPFGNVKSADEFYEKVFVKGARPKVPSHWPTVCKEISTSCWSSFPEERPTMSYIKSMLSAHARDASQQKQNGNGNSLRKSVLRRFTG